MYLIENAHIVNEGRIFKGSILVKGGCIDAIYKGEVPASVRGGAEIIDASDCWLLPGVIDDHVHFRDPGMTEKADFHTESMAAVAGGVTSVMDMPNTKPATTTRDLLEQKMSMAAEKSLCNYSFYIGATDSNIDELSAINPREVCGIKLFLGKSTGGMLVSDRDVLRNIFESAPVLISLHAEDEAILNRNLEHYKGLYGDAIPMHCHNEIRSVEACFKASSEAIELAHRYNTRLHIAHVSTEKELALFEDAPLDEKRITAETCVNYLWFSDRDYDTLGARIKCNPAIKTGVDRHALQLALSSNRIDVVATDHAPHLLSSKDGGYLQAVSGVPSVQFSLVLMLELAKRGVISVETVVDKMCHNPARLFNIEKRGFIRKGYAADLVLVERSHRWNISDADVLSKCAWTPFAGQEVSTRVSHTFINGELVYADGKVNDSIRGMRLTFAR